MAIFALLGVLRGFPVTAYSMYAFLSRFAGTVNPCAAPAKICGISSLIFMSCAQLAQDNPAEAGLN
jgi:hypothetical protein